MIIRPLEKHLYILTIGRIPALASPEAVTTAFASQIPTSKKRSGNIRRIGSSIVPCAMAAGSKRRTVYLPP